MVREGSTSTGLLGEMLVSQAVKARMRRVSRCTSPIVFGVAFRLSGLNFLLPVRRFTEIIEPLAAIFVAAMLGREPISLLGGRLARVRYAPTATKFRNAAKSRNAPQPNSRAAANLNAQQQLGAVQRIRAGGKSLPARTIRKLPTLQCQGHAVIDPEWLPGRSARCGAD